MAISIIENNAIVKLEHNTAEFLSNKTSLQLIETNPFTIEKRQFDTTKDVYGYVGLIVPYKVIITNNSSIDLPFWFVDVLDKRLNYVDKTFKVNDKLITVDYKDNTLSVFLSTIPKNGGVMTVEFNAEIISTN